ncbi:MAG: type I-MYXAN CRISPR-associated protein Cas6/Cmx6 [Gammaproteobacteria bacterium]|nr:type I-MYXAN CRISPR-associated protein Cas6/Cmx6 [Gammaproteobacteria bacterium]
MYWQEDQDKGEHFVVPDDVVDLLFSIECRDLPLDHGFVLSQQIIKNLPWIQEEPQAGIHQIHVAESANGWMRPENTETEVLCVSRRTKMTLRLPASRLDEATALTGKTLDIQGHALTVGRFSTRKLSRLTTIFARYVDTLGSDDETEFLESMQQQLLQKGIRVKKMMSGRLLTHQSDEGIILTRKLMVSDLTVEESVLLQEQGIGDRKLMGMGIFMPHKGIDAVNKKQEG